jgi:hypothetical protein
MEMAPSKVLAFDVGKVFTVWPTKLLKILLDLALGMASA